jgi:homocitrate synthase NifV
VLGKHSGRHAVQLAYEQLLATVIDAEQAERVLPLVRRFVTETKRPPGRAELLRFLAQITPGYVADGAAGPALQ